MKCKGYPFDFTILDVEIENYNYRQETQRSLVINNKLRF